MLMVGQLRQTLACRGQHDDDVMAVTWQGGQR